MPGSDILGSKGQTIVEVAAGGLGITGTPAGGVVTVQGPINGGVIPTLVQLGMTSNDSLTPGSFLVPGSIPAAPLMVSMQWTGVTTVAVRTPAVFKPLSAVVITSETTIWTPAAGKKFRLMGYAITSGVVAGAITLRDNTAGTTILVIPPNTIGVMQYSPAFGNGILSAAANNVLTAQGTATETITGYLFGTEE